MVIDTIVKPWNHFLFHSAFVSHTVALFSFIHPESGGDFWFPTGDGQPLTKHQRHQVTQHHSYGSFSSHRGMNLLQSLPFTGWTLASVMFSYYKADFYAYFSNWNKFSTETIWDSSATLGSFWHEQHFSFEGSLRTKSKIPWVDCPSCFS